MFLSNIMRIISNLMMRNHIDILKEIRSRAFVGLTSK